MPGPALGDNKESIDPKIVPCTHITRREPLCGDGNPPQPPFVEREGSSIFGRSRLDFDEGQGAPPSSNDVHFAAGHASATR